jgi:hypothetical protein
MIKKIALVYFLKFCVNLQHKTSNIFIVVFV